MKQEKENLSGQLNLFDPELTIASKQSSKKNEKTRPDQTKERDLDDDALRDEIKEEMKAASSKKEPEFIAAKIKDMHVAMHRMYEDVLSKESYIVAYIDYNKVYCKEKNEAPTLLAFPSASRAVDHYMEKVEAYMKNTSLIEDEDDLILEDAFL